MSLSTVGRRGTRCCHICPSLGHAARWKDEEILVTMACGYVR